MRARERKFFLSEHQQGHVAGITRWKSNANRKRAANARFAVEFVAPVASKSISTIPASKLPTVRPTFALGCQNVKRSDRKTQSTTSAPTRAARLWNGPWFTTTASNSGIARKMHGQ